jgi:hypothetical protein
MHPAIARTLVIGLAIAPIAGVIATAPASAAPTTAVVATDVPSDSPTSTDIPTDPSDTPSDPTDSPTSTDDPSDTPTDPTPSDTETTPAPEPVEAEFSLKMLNKRATIGQTVTLAGLLVTDPDLYDENGDPTGAESEPVAGATVQLCTQAKAGRGWGPETCADDAVTTAGGVVTWTYRVAAPVRLRAKSTANDTVLAAASKPVILDAKAPKITGKGRHHGKEHSLVLTVDPGAKTLVNVQLLKRGTWQTVRTQFTDAKGRVTVGSLKKGTYRILAAGSTTGVVVGL